MDGAHARQLRGARAALKTTTETHRAPQRGACRAGILRHLCVLCGESSDDVRRHHRRRRRLRLVHRPRADARPGMKCVMLEAGQRLQRAHTYPRNEVDANSQLYWGGGIELTKDASIGLLRPKVVGGGSIVNQALLDRFDDDAFDSWREASGVAVPDPRATSIRGTTAPRAQICISTVPEQYAQRQRRGLPRRLRRATAIAARRCMRAQTRLPLRGRQLLHRVPDGLPHRQQAEHAGHGAAARARRRPRGGRRVRGAPRRARARRGDASAASARDGAAATLPRQHPRARRRRDRQLAPAARLGLRRSGCRRSATTSTPTRST